MEFYNKDEIKEQLLLEQIKTLITEWHGEPYEKNDILICKTICHNSFENLNEASHKLYYYNNSKLFHCYSECGMSFDIFELTQKILNREFQKTEEWTFIEAVEYIAHYFNISSQTPQSFQELALAKDLTYIENYNRISNISINNQIIKLNPYSEKILKYLPQPRLETWEKDGISKEVMDYYNIHYNPQNCSIIIPHQDIDGDLVGIRERHLLQDNIETYGKYRPAYLGGQLYNHPLSFCLYGLYQNKEHIKQMKKVIVFESEKAVLQYATMFGQENNIAVAICGSSFVSYQFWLLMNLGVQEIIIALDHDFTDLVSAEAQRKIQLLQKLHNKYSQFVTLSIIWDKENITGYKASPTDCGREIFIHLFNERISIYE